MSERLIRCRQGHFFDAAAQACPICGATALEANSGNNSSGTVGGGGGVTDPSPSSSRLLLLGGGAALALVVAVGAWSFFKPHPKPVPIVIDDDTKAKGETTTDGGTSTSDTAPKPNDPVTLDGSSTKDGATDVQTKPPEPANTQKAPSPEQTVSTPNAQSGAAVNFKEISGLLGVSDLVVDMTAFFALKAKGGKQPSPAIISALDGLSKRGIGPASAELGIDYLYGIGVAQDDGTAIAYLKTGAEQRQPAARFMLGQIYLDGKLITADPAKGSELLTLAAREGFQPAVDLAQKSKIDSSRFGMTASQLIQMAVSGNRQTVDAANRLINEGLATGYAALAYYAVMYSKDETLLKQATTLAANGARAGLDTGFGALAAIYANPKIATPNFTETAMWLALSARVCNVQAACAPTEANLSALKKKLEPSVASYLDRIDEHILTIATNGSQ